MTGRTTLLALGGLVAAAAVVLLAPFQPSPHSGGDNAAYISLAYALVEGLGYVELWEPGAPDHAKYPPVFPATLALALLLGAGTWAQLKVLPLLFVAGAVLVTFAWVHGRQGPFFAAAVALLVLLSDAFLSASHWILSEAPFVAFVLLSLWAADRALPGVEWRLPGRGGRRDGGRKASRSPRRGSQDTEDGEGAGGEGEEVGAGTRLGGTTGRWILLAGVGAFLAYFTRGAALPLVIAFLLWLALARAWRPLAVYLPVFAIPGFLWWLRGRRVGEDDYASEFWAVDPYRPEAGEAGVVDLLARMATNLEGYVGTHIPEGLVGAQGGLPAILGLTLCALAAVGWGLRAWREPGLAEIFVPLYSGLILLWPEVWSGDRFALPLYPLVLFYAAETLLAGVGRIAGNRAPAVRWSVGAAAFLLLALPALAGWVDRVEAHAACRAQMERDGPWACHPGPLREFIAAAEWSGGHLPEGSVVVNRKPRIFFLHSGVPSRMFPLSPDPDVLLRDMEDAGARYVLLGWMDGVAVRYLQPAVVSAVHAYCHVGGWGSGGESRTDLVALLPEGERPSVTEVREGAEGVAIEPCDDGYFHEERRPEGPDPSGEIPLLTLYRSSAVSRRLRQGKERRAGYSGPFFLFLRSRWDPYSAASRVA